ncbi:MAG TPA: lytic murein transglycosylase [Vicinamibacterales bacterium]|nr:lytic murein transglycosylase [Vicinamibacterales bacterium]
MKILAIAVLAVAVVAAQQQAPPVQEPQQPFDAFVADLRAEALAKGISAATVDAAFAGIEPLAVVVTRDRSQPETTQSLDDYLKQRLTPSRVDKGRALTAEHRELLARVEKAYGLAPATMVAIWGMESNFGAFTGSYPTIAALTTLAWDARRPLFRTELFEALRIVDQGKADASALKGSWAGAMGQPQFMPSSYLTHAVDFDADGKADIWTSLPDVFASMANYLRNSGWRAGERWGREVRITTAVMTKVDREVPMRTSGCRAVREMTVARPLSEWAKLGVTLAGGVKLPTAPSNASLVRGRSRNFLVYRNYEALLAYNCAHSYAVTVGLLSDRLTN